MTGPASARATLRLAHRGDHRDAPENSLAAFATALALPACDGLEFDVRLSRDGVPVVVHDETLERVQERPDLVAALTAEDLGGHGIPTLENVLAVVPRSAFLDVELKVDAGSAVVEALRLGRGERLENTVISSFDPGALMGIRTLERAWPCWLNAESLDQAVVDRAVALGCRGVAAEWRAINRPSLGLAWAAGLEVAAWTVTEPADYRRLARLGVVAICVEGRAL